MGLFTVLRAPRQVVLGCGQRVLAPSLVGSVGSRVLVVGDRRLTTDPLLTEILAALRAAGDSVAIFDEAEPDLPMQQAEKCAELARRVGVDVILGIGGGSCLDLAKVVAVLLTHGGSPGDYYGENRVPGPVVPVIAVPTTAGTGSEVTPVAVLTDPARKSKVGISSPFLIPYAAVCDPELTLSCPAGLTASAGIDTLAHAIESYTAVRREPTPHITRDRVFVGKGAITDQFGRLAVEQVSKYLFRCWRDPEDLEAREGMMLAALAGGYALGNAGTAAAHALQYPVGAITHTPHGVGVGVLLPYVMEFNRPARVTEFAELARTWGLQATDDLSLSYALVAAVGELCVSIGIPSRLDALSIGEDQLDWAAQEAMNAARLVENNPRPLNQAAALMILRAAFHGDLAMLQPSPVSESER